MIQSSDRYAVVENLVRLWVKKPVNNPISSNRPTWLKHSIFAQLCLSSVLCTILLRFECLAVCIKATRIIEA